MKREESGLSVADSPQEVVGELELDGQLDLVGELRIAGDELEDVQSRIGDERELEEPDAGLVEEARGEAELEGARAEGKLEEPDAELVEESRAKAELEVAARAKAELRFRRGEAELEVLTADAKTRDVVETVTESGKELSMKIEAVDPDDVTKLEDEDDGVRSSGFVGVWTLEVPLDAFVRSSASLDSSKSVFDRVENSFKA